MMNVTDIMTVEVNQLPPHASLESAKRLMDDKCIRHLPIVDEAGDLVGLITQRDILALTITGPGEKEVRDPRGATVIVSDVMRTRLFTITEDTDLRQAALKMQMNKIGSLLVVRGKKLLGIITDSDYVGLAINLLEQLEEAEPPELDEY